MKPCGACEAQFIHRANWITHRKELHPSYFSRRGRCAFCGDVKEDLFEFLDHFKSQHTAEYLSLLEDYAKKTKENVAEIKNKIDVVSCSFLEVEEDDCFPTNVSHYMQLNAIKLTKKEPVERKVEILIDPSTPDSRMLDTMLISPSATVSSAATPLRTPLRDSKASFRDRKTLPLIPEDAAEQQAQLAAATAPAAASAAAAVAAPALPNCDANTFALFARFLEWQQQQAAATAAPAAAPTPAAAAAPQPEPVASTSTAVPESSEDIAQLIKSWPAEKRRSALLELTKDSEPKVKKRRSSVQEENNIHKMFWNVAESTKSLDKCPRCARKVSTSLTSRKQHYKQRHFDIYFANVDRCHRSDVERWMGINFGNDFAPAVVDSSNRKTAIRYCLHCQGENKFLRRTDLIQHCIQEHPEIMDKLRIEYAELSKYRNVDDLVSHKLLIMGNDQQSVPSSPRRSLNRTPLDTPQPPKNDENPKNDESKRRTVPAKKQKKQSSSDRGRKAFDIYLDDRRLSLAKTGRSDQEVEEEARKEWVKMSTRAKRQWVVECRLEAMALARDAKKSRMKKDKK